MDATAFAQFQAKFEQTHAGIVRLQKTELSRFRDQFQRLCVGMGHLQEQAAAAERSEAPRFNLFHLFAIASDEVRTHSAMLAELLNPSGRHGQGSLFLEGFVAACRARDADFPALPAAAGTCLWLVETEKWTPLGNLDIVVSCPILRYRFVIENKIYATEQLNQLQRYAEWLSWGGRYYDAQALIFLTPKGWPARSAATMPYFQLSYRDDIHAWLESTLPEVAAPRVSEVLLQYLEVVHHL